jgi:hypothetical protein
MEFRKRLLPALAGAGALLVSLILAGQAPAGAATAHTGPYRDVCVGTPRDPGVVSGTYYDSLKIEGICYVNNDAAVIRANLVVSRNSALIAIWGNGPSLTVDHDLIVDHGATLVMGCERKVIRIFGHKSAVFPCVNDPHQSRPTYSSHDTVNGYLVAHDTLGVVVHNSSIGRNVAEIGGGGGLTCAPIGPFKLFGSPVYSDFEDNQVGGSLRIIGLRSCWLGALRNSVGANLTVQRNKMRDPDAMEINSNWVGKNISCRSNRPRVQFGDGDGNSNAVAGLAFGECGFRVVLPDPAPEAHLHVRVRWKHISVRI